MRMEGQVPVRIGVGEFSIRHIVVVVDCGDEGILGVDVRSRGGVRIDLAARIVSLEGFEVLLELRHSGGCHRVSLAEGTVVRARHRKLVNGRTEGHTGEEA